MSSEPTILAIETAGLAGSIAIMRGAEVIGDLNGDPQVSHSNTLLADLDMLLAQTEVQLSDVDLFAVAAGPGSFTGLRIGLATVKALAATLDRPCAAIPTLQAVALAGGASNTSVALLPAGRGEVFAQSFSVAANGAVAPTINYERTGVATDVSMREGEPVIVGTLNIGPSGDAIILVVSARRTAK